MTRRDPWCRCRQSARKMFIAADVAFRVQHSVIRLFVHKRLESIGYQDRQLAQLATIGRQPVNVTKWFNLYSFDIMGDLAFATSFNMLESTEEHFAVKVLDKGLEPVGWMLPTWMFRLLVAIPGLANDFVRFVKYCNQRLDERMKVMRHQYLTLYSH